MRRSAPTTVTQYLDALPPERRKVVEAVRRVIRKNLPDGYVESSATGMITYEIPLATYPDTYNGHPIWYAALCVQKSHYSLYLMSVYGSAEKTGGLKAAFADAGKKLDMGKACVRFRTLDDLPLDVIGKVIAATPVKAYIAMCESVKRPK